MPQTSNSSPLSRLMTQQGALSGSRVAINEFLKECKRIIKDHQLPAPRCFISYAWEKNSEKNRQLQDRLEILKDDLQKLGASVQLDIRNMQSSLTDFMKQGIEESDYIFLIGTPRLKERLAETGTQRNNAQYEFDEIQKKWAQNPNCLLPLMFDGDFGTAFPPEVMRNLIRDCRQSGDEWENPKALQPYAHTLAALSNPLGLLPVLYNFHEHSNNGVKSRYKSAWDHLHTKLEALCYKQSGLSVNLQNNGNSSNSTASTTVTKLPALTLEGVQAQINERTGKQASEADAQRLWRLCQQSPERLEKALSQMNERQLTVAEYNDWYQSRSSIQQRIDQLAVISSEDSVNFLAEWESIKQLVENASSRVTAEDFVALLADVPALQRALLHQGQTFERFLAQLKPFLRHPNNASRDQWMLQLVDAVNWYWRQGHCANAKSLAVAVWEFLQTEKQAVPRPLFPLLIKALLSSGEIAEALFFSGHYRLLSVNNEVDEKVSRCLTQWVDDYVAIEAVIEQSRVKRFIEQSGADSVNQSNLVRFANGLYHSANRLWLAAEEETENLSAKADYYQRSITAYQALRELVTRSGLSELFPLAQAAERLLPQINPKQGEPLPPPTELLASRNKTETLFEVDAALQTAIGQKQFQLTHREGLYQNSVVRLIESLVKDARLSSSTLADHHQWDAIEPLFLRWPLRVVESIRLAAGINAGSFEGCLTLLVHHQFISQAMADALTACTELAQWLQDTVNHAQNNEPLAPVCPYFVGNDTENSRSDRLSPAAQNLLNHLYKAALLPTRALLKIAIVDKAMLPQTLGFYPRNFFSELATFFKRENCPLTDNNSYQSALQTRTIAFILRDDALLWRSYGQFKGALALSRLSLLTAGDAQAQQNYQCFVDRFSVLFEQWQASESEAERQILEERLLHLPEPNGNRASTLLKARRWEQDLIAITEPPLKTVPTGRFLLDGVRLGKRLLNAEASNQLAQGLNKRVNTYGTRSVIPITIGSRAFLVKWLPEYPGVERAANRLLERLVGGYIQESELFQITDDKGNRYPALLLRKVAGKNIKATYSEERENKLSVDGVKKLMTVEALKGVDGETFSRLFVAALLLSNEDGKTDNVMLHPRSILTVQGENLRAENSNAATQTADTLTFIDNERCFLPAVANVGKTVELQMKQFVFCMDQMKNSIHPAVKQELDGLDIYQLINDWLHELEEENRRCIAIFGQETIATYSKLQAKSYSYSLFGYAALPEQPIILPIVFANEAEERLFAKCHCLKILWQKYPTITHQELLHRLEPMAFKSYKKTFDDAITTDSLTRWKQLEQTYYQIGSRGEAVSTLKGTTIAMQTLAIKTKESLFELMQGKHNACYAPGMSQHRLLRHYQIHTIQEELKAGNTTGFMQLMTDTMRKQVLEEMPFKHIPIATQQTIFKAMQGTCFSHLSLRHADGLTDSLLTNLLWSSGEYIVSIELQNCSQLTAVGISNIAYYCPNLQRLILSDLPKLDYIYQTGYMQRDAWTNPALKLPNLKELRITGCRQLKQIDVDIPAIQTVEVYDNHLQTKFFFAPEAVSKLLDAVMRGNIETVEAQIQQNPLLLYAHGNITDLSDRQFKGVTVFQYAAWASDAPMCEMILQYLPQKAAAWQLNTLVKHPEQYSLYGNQFSFDPLIAQYDKYIANYKNWDNDTRSHHWIIGVGGEQYKVPAWYIHKFMEEGKSVALTEKDTARGGYCRTADLARWCDLIVSGYGWCRYVVTLRVGATKWTGGDAVVHGMELANCEKLAAETYRRSLLQRLDIEQSQNVEATDTPTKSLGS